MRPAATLRRDDGRARVGVRAHKTAAGPFYRPRPSGMSGETNLIEWIFRASCFMRFRPFYRPLTRPPTRAAAKTPASTVVRTRTAHVCTRYGRQIVLL